MLTLTRRMGQTITIGNDIEITVVSISGGRIRLGIRAPRELPVHRAELVERVSRENRKALAQTIARDVARGADLRFPDGLYGLAEHDVFVLYELEGDNPIRALVSCKDPEVQLYVVDAEEAWPGYPASEARQAASITGESAVALVVTVPGNGGEVTANLMAPLVIDLETRVGRQVVLDASGLDVAAAIGSQRATG
ncbi:MAG: carbon storage regulator CsrA [Sandaracinaceae bacterium]